MTENGAWLHSADGAANEMQIGSADGGGSDANDRVGGCLDAWFGYVFKADIANTVINDSFHGYSVTHRSSRLGSKRYQ